MVLTVSREHSGAEQVDGGEDRLAGLRSTIGKVAVAGRRCTEPARLWFPGALSICVSTM